MKKKALVLAIAGALSAPSAWAATDTSGMQFTSASEGFYASVRARYNSGGNNFSGSRIENASSRFGVRGTNDLGGGLSGFYQYEAGFDITGGTNPGTRVGEVGLRGDFGEVRFGSFWTNDYNWTHGSTDQANTQSGYLNYGAYGGNRPGRSDKSAQYTTPDLNGFQGAILLRLNDDGAAGSSDQNDVDTWNIAGSYNIQGFTVAGSYNQSPDSLDVLGANPGRTGQTGVNTPGSNTDASTATSQIVTNGDDATAWTIRLSYAQDNWNVNGWYGETNDGDRNLINNPASDTANQSAQRAKAEDQEFFSIHGGVAIDKVNLYAIYETVDNIGGESGQEDSFGTIGVQYSLGANTRTWIEYASIDTDSGASGLSDDYVNIGLRHDF